jgi:SAM-dependent methyltransferase
MSHSATPVPPPDLAALKLRQQANWAAGDYGVIGTTLQIVGEQLCEAVDLRATEQVLDVAGGNGNASLAAARRFAAVTCTDYVPALLEQARARAQGERLTLEIRQADAEALPFPDASFDVVLSTFGVMFTPDQEKAAAELRRVCRPGGRIGLACWTPESFIGQLFRLLGGFLPPPAGVRSPALWGTEAHLRQLFPGVPLTAATRSFVFRYRSPEHWIEVFRTYYGPVHKAFLALEPARQAELEAGIAALIERCRGPGGPGLVVPSDYLEAVLRPGGA